MIAELLDVWECSVLRSEITVRRFVLGVLLCLVSFSHTSLIAADEATATGRMAQILLTFTHVPNVAQQNAIQGILRDPATTAGERVVATALLHMEHIVSREDQARLAALISDESAPADIKTLATILTHLTHTPTEADKAQLRQLASRRCTR